MISVDDSITYKVSEGWKLEAVKPLLTKRGIRYKKKTSSEGKTGYEWYDEPSMQEAYNALIKSAKLEREYAKLKYDMEQLAKQALAQKIAMQKTPQPAIKKEPAPDASPIDAKCAAFTTLFGSLGVIEGYIAGYAIDGYSGYQESLYGIPANIILAVATGLTFSYVGFKSYLYRTKHHQKQGPNLSNKIKDKMSAAQKRLADALNKKTPSPRIQTGSQRTQKEQVPQYLQLSVPKAIADKEKYRVTLIELAKGIERIKDQTSGDKLRTDYNALAKQYHSGSFAPTSYKQLVTLAQNVKQALDEEKRKKAAPPPVSYLDSGQQKTQKEKVLDELLSNIKSKMDKEKGEA